MAMLAPGPAGVLVPQWTLIVIATGVVIARVWLRLNIQKRRLILPDIFMCLALVSAIATASFDVKFAMMGALDPAVLTSLEGFKGSSEQKALLGKLFWISALPFFVAFYLCKGALLAVYAEVIPNFKKKTRRFLWVTIIFVSASFLISILMLFLNCLPLESNWAMDPKKQCSNDKLALMFVITWFLHFIGDVLIFILPWMIVPGLQMKRKLKISVYCTFLLGLVNISFCLVRGITVLSSTVDNALPISLFDLWSALDLNISLVIACLPSLRPYFQSSKSQEYSYNSNERSANLRPAVEGFTKIHGPGGTTSSRPQVSRGPNSPMYLDPNETDPWDDGKRSVASDIELVTAKYSAV